MFDILPDRLPWYIAGPLIGLCVVALYGLVNRPLGATTAYLETYKFARGLRFDAWRVWFFGGLVVGGFVAAVLNGGPSFNLDYGSLGKEVPLLLLVPLLAVAGFVMGYGARWSGGCTSGHGIRGTSSLSPASWAATATFMATAIAVTFVLHVATGGAL